jgi:hypothetical protein
MDLGVIMRDEYNSADIARSHPRRVAGRNNIHERDFLSLTERRGLIRRLRADIPSGKLVFEEVKEMLSHLLAAGGAGDSRD